jgi:hypothetical protein
VRLEHRLEDVTQGRRAVTVSTLGTAADQDLEATGHQLLSLTGMRRTVKSASRAHCLAIDRSGAM